MNVSTEEPTGSKQVQPAELEPTKLGVQAYLICGWPLLLVAVGGAIGGALGGGAFGVNLMIYKSSLPLAAKIVLNIAVGLAAVVLWLAAAVAIEVAMS